MKLGFILLWLICLTSFLSVMHLYVKKYTIDSHIELEGQARMPIPQEHKSYTGILFIAIGVSLAIQLLIITEYFLELYLKHGSATVKYNRLEKRS